MRRVEFGPLAPPLIHPTLQVIRPETCTPCGKRIRFGKIAMKCRNCRVVAHPECKQGVIISCSTGGATQQVHQVSRWKLRIFLPPLPADLSALRWMGVLVVVSELTGGFCSSCSSPSPSAAGGVCGRDREAGPAGGELCVAYSSSAQTSPAASKSKLYLLNSVCLRICAQRGLYRVPGGERLVKELKDRLLEGKGPPQLNKVHDIHVICGVLKDFLRKLTEPLVTFKLHRAFIEASGANKKQLSCQHTVVL